MVVTRRSAAAAAATTSTAEPVVVEPVAAANGAATKSDTAAPPKRHPPARPSALESTCLVQTYLSEIGLADAWPSFQAAGLTIPSALVDLEPNVHYAALGIESASDRRKLFFLVQRLQQEQADVEPNGIVTATAHSPPRPPPSRPTQPPSPHSRASLTPSPSPPAPYSSPSRSKENHQPAVTSKTTTPVALGAVSSTTTPTVGTPTRPPPRGTLSHAPFLPCPPPSLRHRPDARAHGPPSPWRGAPLPTPPLGSSATTPRPTPPSGSSPSTTPVSSPHRTSLWNLPTPPPRAVPGTLGSPPLSHTVSPPRTTYTRLDDTMVASLDALLADETPVRLSRDSPLSSPTVDAGENSMERHTESTVSTHTNAPVVRSVAPTASALLDEVLNGTPAVEAGVAIPVRQRSSTQSTVRTSGLAAPSNDHRSLHRTTGHRPNPSKSLRTGKPLSSIPAQSVPPPSPLVSVALHAASPCHHGAVSVLRGVERRRSHSLDNGVKRPMPAVSNLATNTGMVRSNSAKSLQQPRRAFRPRASLSRTDSDQSLGSTESSSRRRSMVAEGVMARRAVASTDRSRRRLSTEPSVSTMATPTLGSHGVSFKTQIEALRLDTAAEHDLFGGTNVPYETDPDTMRIRVVVRKRPLSTVERLGDVDVIHPLECGSYGRILVYQPKTRVDLTKQIETTSFGFDDVFDETATNADIYQRTVRTMIPSLLDDGQWASVFAYGQTGSGKTYTMMGNNFTGMNDARSPRNVDVANLGLYYMAALDVFHAIRTPGYETFSIRVSLFEIYGGKLFDLLNGRAPVKCLEDSKGNVCFPGLSEHRVSDSDALMDMITQGAALRSTGTTSRNADSSRSHAVLQLHLYKPQKVNPQQRVSLANRQRAGGSQGNVKEWSRLTFIDLAGSERGADTSQASRATRLEGAEINTSLLALKEVIRALACGDSLSHVPFRGSKLTQVLKQSFVGKNCQSVMIACISPNMSSCEQTLNTLRYADRVKERNPETGELAARVSTKGATTPKSKPVATRSETSSTSHVLASNLAGSDNVVSRSNSSVHSKMLDELLASPPSGASDDELSLDSENDAGETKFDRQLREVTDILLATHQDARSFMLDMVKEEMSLVKEVDANRDGMDDYISRVHTLHEEQLAMITILREQLLQYRLLSQRIHIRQEFLDGQDDVNASTNDDDSFDDLRS